MTSTQAARNLFKSLSALRATLSDEEQALLDAIVQSEHDIAAHELAATAPFRVVYNSENEVYEVRRAP